MHMMLFQLMVLGVFGWSCSAVQEAYYDDTPNPEFLSSSWMSSIPNDRPLSEITMPGTHNTMALGDGIFACQSWSLASQLRAGIRFLDILVRYENGNLAFHSVKAYQYAHFGEVLDDVVDFLREFPSETVLIRIKEEYSSDIYKAVVNYIHLHAHWDLLWHGHLMPTMGKARGKIVVLQDFPGPALGMSYYSLDIATAWEVITTTINHVEKWESARRHLLAATEGNKAQIFLTFCSGTSWTPSTKTVAQIINKKLYDFLLPHLPHKPRFGIITMDFQAAPLIQLITKFN